MYVLSTYYNIDINDLAAMEPARKAITHHAWHVMTFFFIHRPKLYIPSTIKTDYILWHTQLIVYALTYFDPKMYTF